MITNTKLRLYVGLTTLVMGLVAAPAALADSAVETYGGAGGASAAGVASGASGSSTAADPGSLPFTGLDVGLLVGGGLLLVLIGVAMARVARRVDPQGS